MFVQQLVTLTAEDLQYDIRPDGTVKKQPARAAPVAANKGLGKKRNPGDQRQWSMREWTKQVQPQKAGPGSWDSIMAVPSSPENAARAFQDEDDEKPPSSPGSSRHIRPPPTCSGAGELHNLHNGMGRLYAQHAVSVKEAHLVGSDVLQTLASVNEDKFARLEAEHASAAENEVLEAALAAAQAEAAGAGHEKSGTKSAKVKRTKNIENRNEGTNSKLEFSQRRERSLKRQLQATTQSSRTFKGRSTVTRSSAVSSSSSANRQEEQAPQKQAEHAEEDTKDTKAPKVGSGWQKLKSLVGSAGFKSIVRANERSKPADPAAEATAHLSKLGITGGSNSPARQTSHEQPLLDDLADELPQAPMPSPSAKKRESSAGAMGIVALAEALKTLAGQSSKDTTGQRRLSVSSRLLAAGSSTNRELTSDTGIAAQLAGAQCQEEAKQKEVAAREARGDKETPGEEPFSTRRDDAAADINRERKSKEKWKVIARSFEAPLCSFQKLVNVDNNPMLLSEALDKYRSVYNGQNFTWESSRGAYGGKLNITYPIILWYQHSWTQLTRKSRTSCIVSFVHKPGCCFVYQPTVPLTHLFIEPKHNYKPMFEFDPRSYHIFKLAWRFFLDFGSTDYRAIVGEQLERWIYRCKVAIEKPFNAVYWLMLMVGSHYRETLGARRVVSTLRDPSERVPVICIDSFVALSALLFSPERQVLFAGVDPTPSYLRWLRYIGDQNYWRKDPEYHRNNPNEKCTVFEMNEFLDLPVIIIFYGRPQHRARESDPLAWVNSPTLVKSYIARYMEDNKCASQLELATRLYTYSCCVGYQTPQQGCSGDHTGDKENWYTWNGLRVCEIGVPLPTTQSSFLSPFVTMRSVAVLCPLHGADAVRASKQKKKQQKEDKSGSGNGVGNGMSTGAKGDYHSEMGEGAGLSDFKKALAGNRGNGSNAHGVSSSSGPRSPSIFSTASRHGNERSSQVKTDSSDANSSDSEENDDEDDTETSVDSRHRDSRSTLLSGGGTNYDGKDGKVPGKGFQGVKSKGCICSNYAHVPKKEKQGKEDKSGEDPRGPTSQRGGGEETILAAELRLALSSLGEYDLLHTFAAVLAGGLNVAKMVIRLHFSIDPMAYNNLPPPACNNWSDGLMPWYREFHRTDIHCRSRYTMLLTTILRGMLGDGFTSGLHDEALDFLRSGGQQSDISQQEAQKVPVEEKKAGVQTKLQASQRSGSQLIPGLRRPSLHHHLGGNAARQSIMLPSADESPSQLQPKDAEHAAQASGADSKEKEGDKGKPDRGPYLLNGIKNWCELLGTESPVDVRTHFETFNQWCHSAHLIAFIKRCYRRLGIAGLAPIQHVGGHRHGMDPFHPLVLPTVPDFCYGHCYPLHKVLQYFYGGTETIVCSADDTKVTEAERANLGLIAGQERLNNQCWFQAVEDPETKAAEKHNRQDSLTRGGGVRKFGDLNQSMLDKLEEQTRAGAKGALLAVPSSPPSPMVRQTRASFVAGSLAAGQMAHKLVPSRTAAAHGPGAHLSKMSSNDDEDKKGTGTLQIKQQTKRPNIRSKARETGPGVLVAEDPFFWFCYGNFSLYTYPASHFSRSSLTDPRALNVFYSDFVSRSGTPIRGNSPERLQDEMDSGAASHKVAPPSICICQPTELSGHVRKRWKVQMDFADDEKLLLGDSGWFPGALGHRFTFEAKTDNVQRYVLLSSMPQASLTYVQYVRRSSRKDKKKASELVEEGDKKKSTSISSEGEDDESTSSDSEVDHNVEAHQWRLPYFYKSRQKRNGASTQKVWKNTVDLMLPPLISA